MKELDQGFCRLSGFVVGLRFNIFDENIDEVFQALLETQIAMYLLGNESPYCKVTH